MARRRLFALGAVAVIAVSAMAVMMMSAPPDTVHAGRAAPATDLRSGPRPAFVPARPQLLPHNNGLYRWASMLRSVNALAAPAAGPSVASVGVRTPEGTTNLVLVLGTVWRHAAEWVHVRLPILPNNSSGWLPRSALGGYHFVITHLVVDIERLQATLLRDGRPVFRAPVGVGEPQWPTPRGEFFIRDELTSYASPFYGPVAFGTSARSSVLTDWPAGGFVGIHGTDAPQLIPGQISHGCIRLRNADLLRLARIMPVGTPLTIQ